MRGQHRVLSILKTLRSLHEIPEGLIFVGSNLKTVWHLLEIQEILETYSIRELQREWSVQSSSQACVIVRLQPNELQSKRKTPKLHYKYTSVTHKMVKGGMVMDMLDLYSQTVCVCNRKRTGTDACQCVYELCCNACTPTVPVYAWQIEQTLLHLHVCVCLHVCERMFVFACLSQPVCVCVCVLCWMPMHVFAECLGDWGLWLSFGVFCSMLVLEGWRGYSCAPALTNINY